MCCPLETHTYLSIYLHTYKYIDILAALHLTCIIHSIRYSWDIGSLHLIICSKTFDSTFCHSRTENVNTVRLLKFLVNVTINKFKNWNTYGDLKISRDRLHTSLYRLTSIPSNWLKRTRLVPTSKQSSWRSFSRLSLSRVCPWCCMRTHNLFISEKFNKMKSIESCTSPSIPLLWIYWNNSIDSNSMTQNLLSVRSTVRWINT